MQEFEVHRVCREFEWLFECASVSRHSRKIMHLPFSLLRYIILKTLQYVVVEFPAVVKLPV